MCLSNVDSQIFYMKIMLRSAILGQASTTTSPPPPGILFNYTKCISVSLSVPVFRFLLFGCSVFRRSCAPVFLVLLIARGLSERNYNFLTISDYRFPLSRPCCIQGQCLLCRTEHLTNSETLRIVQISFSTLCARTFQNNEFFLISLSLLLELYFTMFVFINRHSPMSRT